VGLLENTTNEKINFRGKTKKKENKGGPFKVGTEPGTVNRSIERGNHAKKRVQADFQKQGNQRGGHREGQSGTGGGGERGGNQGPGQHVRPR